jgi:hypothetical protein
MNMKALKSKVLSGLVVAGLSLVTATGALAQNINVEYNNALTVRQGIRSFADRFGDIVILHGALNLNAPIAADFEQGVSSGQAISFLSQAAGAKATRVYFVTPARSTVAVTTGTAARRLVRNNNPVEFRLANVSARAAILSVAAADNAEVRFPDGVPTGNLTLSSISMPIDRAISIIAAETHTHWSKGYVLDSMNPALTQLTPGNRSDFAPFPSETATALNGTTPNASATTGDSSAAVSSEGGLTLSGDSSAAGQFVPTRRFAATAVPAGGLPSIQAVQNGKMVTLPAEAPLPRDSSGNILPITIHLPRQAAATGNVAAGALVSPDVSINDYPTFTSDGNLGSGAGTIQTFTPNSLPGGQSSGLGFGANSVAFGPNSYGAGFMTNPGYTWY